MAIKIPTLNGKAIDDWTFSGVDTQYLTHGIHPYPARMVPQLAKTLIQKYSDENKWILDPFCGSGTTLVECKLNNRCSIGNEINPLALLLTKVKSLPPDDGIFQEKANKLLKEIDGRICSYREKYVFDYKLSKLEEWTGESEDIEYDESNVVVPKIPNIDLWYKPYVINELAIIKKSISNLDCEPEIKALFNVCLSYTALKSSNADFDKHQSHPSRYKKDKLKMHRPDTFAIFRDKVNDSIKRIKGFSRKAFDVKCILNEGDARKLELENIPDAPNKIDLIVTSPPYGEEKNTIGYMRWAKLAMYWLGFSSEQINFLEKLTLGGQPRENSQIPSETANLFINLVREKANRKNGSKRAVILGTFFYDYYQSLMKMSSCLKEGGYAGIVVGNRLVTGHRIAMDEVTIELGKNCGLKEINTFHRDIPNTVMPKRIPEGETIARESIIILEKV